ncbi:MAG: PAS/PAC sensor signal transduction histidine kinase [bacterium]|nr:MAG: PAS/PAC sensor signal transduction histidine kinase [bacterium]KAF0148981.1 MAG: PAS/PAC sensor signal transduction histidine kinase [bacterium]KAF0168372.1 MAG: PAS/PAC sensor signal transduction histidine kinase [bacterium]TXT21036.1 MAG: PAS/PAC sensor signal transduction histidine kinase [bacterium]
MVHHGEVDDTRAKPTMPLQAPGRAGGKCDKAWLECIFDAMPAPIAVLDAGGRIISVNHAWRGFTELNVANAQVCAPGENYLEVLRAAAEHGDGGAAHALVALTAALRGEKPRFELEYPCHGARQDDWFLLKAAPLSGQGGCVVMYVDISERKRAEQEQARQAGELREAYDALRHAREQLTHAEKMASIGQLAAGVAHEINNPIGYLHSNLGTLGQYVQDVLAVVAAFERVVEGVATPACRAGLEQAKRETDFAFLLEDIPKLLEESQEGIQRVRKIVQDLKDFAHAGDNEDWQWQDLRHCLKRTLNIVHNELKYKAEVHLECEDIPEIRCLPGQLNQVIMNLLVNAAHAIETKGVVRVRAWREAEWVWVAISDTGCGIPQEVIDRIFDPFFTTKPVGKGTGLGLSISYGIVKKHGGRIEVESQVGQGTTFRVGLPIEGPEDAE